MTHVDLVLEYRMIRELASNLHALTIPLSNQMEHVNNAHPINLPERMPVDVVYVRRQNVVISRLSPEKENVNPVSHAQGHLQTKDIANKINALQDKLCEKTALAGLALII